MAGLISRILKLDLKLFMGLYPVESFPFRLTFFCAVYGDIRSVSETTTGKRIRLAKRDLRRPCLQCQSEGPHEPSGVESGRNCSAP